MPDFAASTPFSASVSSTTSSSSYLVTLQDFWQAGGPVMYALLAIGIAMATIAVERSWFLFGPAHKAWRRDLHRQLINDPDPVWQTAALSGGLGQLKLLQALVAMAPLVGLLGTVSGMLVTFANLGSLSSGSNSNALAGGGAAQGIGKGIGQAMITTQVGLVLALPGLLASRLLSRRAEALVARACAGALRHRSTVTLRKIDSFSVVNTKNSEAT